MMDERATTAIYIRIKHFDQTYFVLCDEYETIKHFDQTYFVLCDEYETIESLKNRLLVVL